MYGTQQDMSSRFGDAEMVALAPSGTPGGVDAARVTGALEDASSEADSYLAARYAVPLASPPRMLLNAVCDIARYRLTGGDALETESVVRRYEEAVRWLRAVSSGKADIPLPPPAEEMGVNIYAGERVW